MALGPGLDAKGEGDPALCQCTISQGSKLFTGHFSPRLNEPHSRSATDRACRCLSRARLPLMGEGGVLQVQSQVQSVLGQELLCFPSFGEFA